MTAGGGGAPTFRRSDLPFTTTLMTLTDGVISKSLRTNPVGQVEIL